MKKNDINHYKELLSLKDDAIRFLTENTFKN